MVIKSVGGSLEAEKLLLLVDRLTELANDADDFIVFIVARELFDLTNVRIFFRFKPEQQRKSVVNRSRGQVTFSAAESPSPSTVGRQTDPEQGTFGTLAGTKIFPSTALRKKVLWFRSRKQLVRKCKSGRQDSILRPLDPQ